MRAIALLVLVALGRTAAADSDAEKRAAALFDEGRDLAKAGNYADACARFTDSLALVPAVGTQLNLADCLEHQGKLARAAELFEAAARADAQSFPERAKMAAGRAEKLAARLATIVVKPAEPGRAGLHITVGGDAVTAAAEIDRRVDPGTIEIVATAPGAPDFRRSVTAAEGQRVVVEIPAPAAPSAAVTPVPDGSAARRHRLYLAGGLAAGGVIALGVGGYLALDARSAYADELGRNCFEQEDHLRCNDLGTKHVTAANHRADIATGVLIAGGVLAAGAVVVYLTAPHAGEGVQVTPSVGPSGATLAISGSF